MLRTTGYLTVTSHWRLGRSFSLVLYNVLTVCAKVVMENTHICIVSCSVWELVFGLSILNCIYYSLCLFYFDYEKRKLLFFHKLKILSLTAALKVIFLI